MGMVIQQESKQPIYLGVSADLTHLYVPGEPGIECLVAKPTYFNAYTHAHVVKDHPERLEWLASDHDLICQAVQEPEVVYRHLEYKDTMGHWSQAYVIKHPGKEGRWLTVVLSLAWTSGTESADHQVITVYYGKLRDVYRNSSTDAAIIKDKWLEVVR